MNRHPDIAALNRLSALTFDSVAAYLEAARETDDELFRPFLLDRAKERREAINDMQARVSSFDDGVANPPGLDERETGFRRSIGQALADDRAGALISAIEAAEQSLERAYRAEMGSGDLGADTADLIAACLQIIERGREEIAALRRQLATGETISLRQMPHRAGTAG